MSTEENKRLARRFIEEIFVKGNLTAVDELVARDLVPRSWPGVRPGLRLTAHALHRGTFMGMMQQLGALPAPGKTGG